MAGPVQTLVIRIAGDTKQFNAAMAGVNGKVAATGTKMASMGKSMTKGLTVPLLAVAGGAMYAQAQIGGAMRTIRRDTGATGTKLEGLGENFKTVFKKVPASAGEVSKVLAAISTRTGLTGKPLEKLTEQIVTLGRVAGVDSVNMARLATRAFGDWEIKTKDQASSLDWLYKVSQNTGIGVDALADKTVRFGAPMRQLGFSFEQATATIGSFEKAGVNTDQVLTSLKIGLGKLAKAGEKPAEAFGRLVNEIAATEDPTERIRKSIELFGSRAGPDMAEAIKQGRFSIEELMKTLTKSPETIEKVGEDTLTFKDRMMMLKNEAIVAAAPLGKTLWEALRSLIAPLKVLIKVFSSIMGVFTRLPAPIRTGIIVFGGLLAAIGPIMSVGGRLVGTFSRLTSAAAGIGKGIGAAVRWIGGLGGGMSSLSNVASGMQTPLLATSQATSQVGAQAATTASRFGSFASAALPIAGIIAGIGVATWACWNADNKAEEARQKNIISASNMTAKYDELKTKTDSLVVGTAEHTAAMQEQAAAADAIVQKTAMVGAQFDEVGNVIGVDTQLINLMADGYRKGTTEQVNLAQATARGTQTLSQGVKVHAQYGQSAESAKKKLDDFTEKMYAKMRAGQEMSANDQIILSSLTQSWQSALQGQGSALDSMQKAIDKFNEKISGPTGLSAVTKKDLNQMVTAMGNASPQVREKGLAMFQQIINAEAAKNPAIQSNMTTIMSGIKNRINALKAGELTNAKMQEIINSEVGKYGPITGEMGTIVSGLTDKIAGWDARGQITEQMGKIEAGIDESTAVTKFGEMVGSLTSKWNELSLADKSTTIDVWVNYAEKTRERQGRDKQPHGGGRVFSTGFYKLQEGEEVIRRSAANRLGQPLMNLLNSGIMPAYGGGSVTVEGGIHIHSVSEEYDAQKLLQEMNELARRANHTGRLLVKGR